MLPSFIPAMRPPIPLVPPPMHAPSHVAVPNIIAGMPRAALPLMPPPNLIPSSNYFRPPLNPNIPIPTGQMLPLPIINNRVAGHSIVILPPRGSITSGIIDPNNDVSSWSEHKTEDGRRYWYNNITKISTYDKPNCLKTPEERSIPACEWKEFTSNDGSNRKYYNNGIESV